MEKRRDRGSLHVLVAVIAFAMCGSALAAQVDGLTDAVSTLSGQLLQYAGVLASVSVLAVAILELLKALMGFRRRFHQYAIGRWLRRATEREETEKEFYYLAIGSHVHLDALFELELDKLMGQVQAAARIALEYPDKFTHLYDFLTCTDIELKPNTPGKEHVGRTDPATWRAKAAEVRDFSIRATAASTATPAPAAAAANAMPTPASASAAPAPTTLDAAQARARLANLVSRKLDGLQMRIGYGWSRTNQAASLVISVALMIFLLDQVDGSAGTPGKVALGIIGGLLAPFMKDFSQSLASIAKK
jgi:hypothetical protein